MPVTKTKDMSNALKVALAKSDDALTEDDLRLIGTHHMKQHKLRSPGLDYTAPNVFDNVAIYTPALSGGYVKDIEELAEQEEQAHIQGDPSQDPFAGFDFTAKDLKFTTPNSKLCFYPWVLFSAGQGAKTDAVAQETNWITERLGRDPRVVVLGDSGGFQIQGQTISFDPKTTPIRMLKWLERLADQSMILDFPTGGIATGAMEPHIKRLEADGIPVSGEAQKHKLSRGYVACLLETERNNDIFLKHRTPGATKLLNVIQGRNEQESAFWYQRVKRFSQAQQSPFEGWSFAGKHSVQLSMTLRRLIQMRDDGLLQPAQYIHFLGVSTLKVGAALTFIQRSLRKHTDASDVQITFDTKSPVDMMANGYRAITGFDLSPDKWSLHSQPTNLPANATSQVRLREMAVSWVANGEHRQIARTGLGGALKVKDLVAAPNPNGSKAVPSKLQQALLVHHNTQAMIEAFRCVYKLLDEKHFNERPSSVRWMGEMIDLVFNTEAPISLIDELEGRVHEISAETENSRHKPTNLASKIDLLEEEARTSKSIAQQLRLMPSQPMKLIDELELQLDALVYEGVFGK
jgi:hypothetical protein